MEGSGVGLACPCQPCDGVFMHPHGGPMQCEGPISVIPKNGDSRQESVYIHYEWEQES